MSATPPGMPRVAVDPRIDARDERGVRGFYVDSTVQPFVYEGGPARYARLIAETVASFAPGSVLEFGCGSGRNLAVLRELSAARLAGVDINPTAIDWGRRNFGLDLCVGDDRWLAQQGPNAFDIIYTVSVIDHIPSPQRTVSALVKAAADFVIIYEIMHTSEGRVVRMEDSLGELVDGYPFSYFHNYPPLFDHAGAWLVADIVFPADDFGLMPYYRLHIYTKRPEWRRRPLIEAVRLARP